MHFVAKRASRHVVALRAGRYLPALSPFTHIKELDDCFGQSLVRVALDCGGCREIGPEALARLVGWSIALKELAADALSGFKLEVADRRSPGLTSSGGRLSCGDISITGSRLRKREGHRPAIHPYSQPQSASLV